MKRWFIIFILILFVTTVYADKLSRQIEKKNHSNVKTYNWEETASKFINDEARDGRSVPGVIDYQGKITDSSSNPITNNVDITFAIYNVSSGGTNLWDETHSNVTPVDGLVHVLLGSRVAFEDDLFDGSDLWLGINVDSDGEMSPRLRIASVPYAMNADNLDGHDSDYFMTADADFEIDDLTDGKTGGYSVFLGTSAGANDNGSNTFNTGIGVGSLTINSSATNNTSVGYFSLFYNTGSVNTALGTYSLYRNTTGAGNVGIGSYANQYNQTGSNNTIIGYNAGKGSELHNKSGNIFIGYSAGSNETDSNRLYIENSESTTPLIYGEFENDFVKINGDIQITDELRDSDNQAGTNGQILSSTGSGTDWIEAGTGDIGIDDLIDAKSIGGSGSVFLGSGAGANDDGTYNGNTAVGINALNTNTISGSNTAFGQDALFLNTGPSNTAIGASALYNSTGSSNTALGKSSLFSNSTGYSNVGVGFEANYYNQVGSNNTIIGHQAGRGSSNHNKYCNVLLGSHAGYSATGSFNIFLGNQAGTNETGSHRLYIENSDSATPLIYGEFDNDWVKINGDFEVTGTHYDDDHDAGTNGQVLSSTGSGTDWIDAASGDGHSLDAADGSPTDIVYVDNDGDVGIGTTTPTEMLEVAGTIYSNLGGFKFPDGTTQTTAASGDGDITAVTAGTGLTGGGESGDVVLSHEDTSSQISVNNSNGTVIQDIILDGFGHITGIVSPNLDSRYYTETEIDANYVSNSDLNHLDAADGSPTDVVFVDNDGDVGIGTTSPSYKLDVDGDINISTDNAYKINGIDILHNEGYQNIFLGIDSGTNTTSNFNTFIGAKSGFSNEGGSNNVFLGVESGTDNIGGGNNTFIGRAAGSDNISGAHNTYLGNYSGLHSTGEYNVFLGNRAGEDETTGSNMLYIENSNTNTPLIYGEFDNDYLKINGDFETTGTATIGDVLHLTPMASAPSSPSEGDIYVDSDDDHIYCYLGGIWKQLD